MFNFMPTANINRETGIHFGAISGNSLDPDVLNSLHIEADYIVFNAYLFDCIKQFANEHEFEYSDGISFDELDEKLLTEYEDEYSEFVESTSDNYQADEPSASFECEGVSVVYGWLGGAPLIIVNESPFVTFASPCSPCVPNAGDLDNLDPDGVECYTVPENWKADFYD